MKFYTYTFGLFFLLMFTQQPVFAQELDAEGSKDHPLIERMPDFYIGRSEESAIDKETFKTTQGNIEVQGKRFYIDYRLRSGKTSPGKMQVLNYYQAKLNTTNADVLLDGPYYDVYKIATTNGETWVKIDPGVYDGKRYEVTIVESENKTDFVVNQAEVIKTEMLTMTGLNPKDRIIKTTVLQMTGLNLEDRIIRTTTLQMNGLNPEDRIIRTTTLQMAGLNPEDRIIKTEKLTMTGLEQ